MKLKHMLGLLSAAAMSLALTGGAVAQQTVKIGAIFPFSGNAASAESDGQHDYASGIHTLHFPHYAATVPSP